MCTCFEKCVDALNGYIEGRKNIFFHKPLENGSYGCMGPQHDVLGLYSEIRVPKCLTRACPKVPPPGGTFGTDSTSTHCPLSCSARINFVVQSARGFLAFSSILVTWRERGFVMGLQPASRHHVARRLNLPAGRFSGPRGWSLRSTTISSH